MHRAVLAVVLLASVPCIWDSDTLGDELRGLPDALRLVTGRWYRHSDDYYAARIATLPARLEAEPGDLPAYDDLAVAYERRGAHDDALDVLARKRAALDRLPADDAQAKEHRYRELANRGTVLAHAGRFDEALPVLEAAIALNPAAHFGRERWQIAAIRYVAACKRDPSLWSSHDFLTFSNVLPEPMAPPITGRASYTVQRLDEPRRVPWDELYTAIAGMLRFGGRESAELYRTLGDLHLAKQDLHLAWWAYGVAIERGHPAAETIAAARASIVEHWREAMRIERKRIPIPTDDEFRAVRASGAKWLAAFQRFERAAIGAGEDVTSEAALKRRLARADAEVEELLPTGAKATTR
ncbi:MAG: hypothetical protein HZB39_08125 [Planctomycetes bacterium]|nr:hypothetical protein [Planctomycetota bacterium]